MASDTLASLAVGVTNAIGTIIAATIIEKTGRTTLLKNSYVGQGLAMFFMAAGFSIPSLQVGPHASASFVIPAIHVPPPALTPLPPLHDALRPTRPPSLSAARCSTSSPSPWGQGPSRPSSSQS